MTPLQLVLTGATGMVGEGVLHECLQSSEVGRVVMINRRPSGITHPKLTEVLHGDFNDISPVIGQLGDFDACFFCAGVSSVGKKESTFYELTYTLTLSFARTLAARNPSSVFCYISGAGTDSSEKGRLMWARVKGKTENDLGKLPFRAVYNFRPGILYPTRGLKNTLSMYRYLGWLIPVIKLVAPGAGTTLAELGQAMIRATASGYPRRIIEVKDIRILANTGTK